MFSPTLFLPLIKRQIDTEFVSDDEVDPWTLKLIMAPTLEGQLKSEAIWKLNQKKDD